MFTPFLADAVQEMTEQFGLHTDAFIAHTIAFFILAAVVVYFGIKPIMKQLEERRQRIEEGEAMHERSQKELAEVKITGERIVADAREEGRKQIEHARQTATKLQEDLTAKATLEARTIVSNARQQADMNTRREKEVLKGEFARLVAAATAQVTGKVLTEEDHRTINAEAISKL